MTNVLDVVVVGAGQAGLTVLGLCDGLEARLREEHVAAQPSARIDRAIADHLAPQASLEALQQHSLVDDPLFAAYLSYMAWVA